MNRDDITFIVPVFRLSAHREKTFWFTLSKILETGCKVLIVQQKDRYSQHILEENLMMYPVSRINYCELFLDGPFSRSKCINLAAKKVTTKFAWVNDIDCYLKFKDILEDVPIDKKFVQPFVSVKDLTKDQTKAVLNKTPIEIDFKETDTRQVRIYGAMSFICEIREFLKIGGMDEQYIGWGLEDYDLFARVYKDYDIGFIKNSFGVHLWHVPAKSGHNEKIIKYKGLDIGKIERDATHLVYSELQQTQVDSYISSGSDMSEKTFKIDEVHCINLKDKRHLWEEFDELDLGIQLLDAVDSRNDPKIYEKFGLSLCPGDEGQDAYFSHSPGAVGCYLSHYLIWQKAIQNNTEWTLAIEDDAEVKDIVNLLTTYKIPYPLDENIPRLIQFNRRTHPSELPYYCNGTEAFAFNQAAAKAMLHLTHDMSYLAGTDREYFWLDEYAEYAESLRASDKQKKFDEGPAIRYAADKFLGYCSHEAIPSQYRLRIKIVPTVSLRAGNENGSAENSDVMSKDMQPHWNMSVKEFEEFKKHPKYKWWEK